VALCDLTRSTNSFLPETSMYTSSSDFGFPVDVIRHMQSRLRNLFFSNIVVLCPQIPPLRRTRCKCLYSPIPIAVSKYACVGVFPEECGFFFVHFSLTYLIAPNCKRLCQSCLRPSPLSPRSFPSSDHYFPSVGFSFLSPLSRHARPHLGP